MEFFDDFGKFWEVIDDIVMKELIDKNFIIIWVEEYLETISNKKKIFAKKEEEKHAEKPKICANCIIV